MALSRGKLTEQMIVLVFATLLCFCELFSKCPNPTMILTKASLNK